MDYFPEDFLVVIDESHVTVPQLGAMFEGDASRKRTLVEHGFRLPSALDNRPLRWPEFLERVGQTVYLSATPGKYEMEKVGGDVVEQVIRPTGLVDPAIIIKPIKGQVLPKGIVSARRALRTHSIEVGDYQGHLAGGNHVQPEFAYEKHRLQTSHQSAAQLHGFHQLLAKNHGK